MIKAYEPDYKKAKENTAALVEQQKSAEKKVKAASASSFAAWNRALNLAEAHFRARDFSVRSKKARGAAKRLLQYLDAPDVRLRP